MALILFSCGFYLLNLGLLVDWLIDCAQQLAYISCFYCRNVDILMRAYLTYVRPIVEHNSVIWSQYIAKDMEYVETV